MSCRRMGNFMAALLLLLIAGSLCACGNKDTSRYEVAYRQSEEGGAVCTLENELLRLTVDPADTSVVLTDKRTGAVWNSVPAGAETDPLADSATRKAMRSPLLLRYEDERGNASTYDGYTYSVEGRTFEVEAGEDTITVRYMVGPAERTYRIPEAVTEERMTDFLSRMDDAGRGFVMRNYLKIDLTKIKDEDKKKSYEEAVPALADGPMYVLPSVLPGGGSLKNYQLVQTEEIFASIGYSDEDLEADRVIREEEGKTDIRYNVTLVYSLEDDSLRVDVPLSEIRYPEDYPVTELRILPYLMHADDKDTGYMLLPDGGGAQVFFHNGKARSSSYYADIYGYDEALERKLRVQDTRADFPVFAIAKNGNYLMGIITDGAADAGVEADVGGKRGNYDYVRPVFKIVHGQNMDISAKSVSTVRVFQSSLSDETMTVRYVCGSGDSYAGMAERYGQYLDAVYGRPDAERPEGVPLVVEFVGAIDRMEKFLGIPVHRTYVAAEPGEVLSAVKELSGVPNLAVRYTDIFNGGQNQTALFEAELTGGLGSRDDVMACFDELKALGARLYLGACVEEVRDTALFDGYSSLGDSVRDVSDTVIVRYPYYVDTLGEREDSDPGVRLLRADAQSRTFAALLGAAAGAGAGVSYQDAGRLLYSDFGQDNYLSRDGLADIQRELARAAAEAAGIMAEGGSEFIAAQADIVIGLDMAGSGYDIVDRQVPFYQMALRGRTAYTGVAVNTSGDRKGALLRAAETGAGLYYRFFETDYEDVRFNTVTWNDTLYGANFASVKDELLRDYGRLESEMGELAAFRITDHMYLADGVTKTVYENGAYVVVNYTGAPFELDGTAVPAGDFAVFGKGE